MYILLCCVNISCEIPLGRKADNKSQTLWKITIDGGKVIMSISYALMMVLMGYPAVVCEVRSQTASTEKVEYMKR